ncbi:MAG: tRNA epoxyqueuosine(34) reductase QueG [Bdellovibrionales bacterium]|nr:tRNA epoxyqueuosine(34) reductase QueG [Bdellovibrionales bacterium]
MKILLMNSFVKSLKQHAKLLGFSQLGITNNTEPSSYNHYLSWVNHGYAGNMHYMSESYRKQRRKSAKNLLPSTQSILVGTFSYYRKSDFSSPLKFARYGWGKDYHIFVAERLHQLETYMRSQIKEPFETKIVVDTSAILERDFAKQAGVGWIGKNTMLLHKEDGSYLYLGLILTSLKLPEDKATTSHCGSCTACLDACPTNAFEKPFVLNAKKCISYQTLENRKEDMPKKIKSNLHGWIAGCDICQEVCPWNRKAKQTNIEETNPLAHPSLTAKEIEGMQTAEFEALFKETAFFRTGLVKLKKNAESALKTLQKPSSSQP